MLKYQDITAPNEIFSIKFISIYVASIALLIVSSKLQVPMIPVPITFQTAAIMLIPALFGMKLSMSALGSWLMLGSLGVPVFAGNVALPGLVYFMGPTGGYFIGFIVATALTALTIHKAGIKRPIPLMSLFFIMHGIIIFTGWIWLSYGTPQLGAEKAWLVGALPFLVGSVLKSAIVTALVYPIINKKD